jgi:organic radical activating enzyme
MVNDFCFLLSNGLFITDKEDTNLIFKPCCIFEEKSFSYSTNAWSNIKNWTDSCSRCLLKENNNKKSRRQEMNEWFTDVKKQTLTHLEIDYSNACNAACGMCYPIASSKIAKIMQNEGKNYIPRPKVKQQTFIDTVLNLDLQDIKLIKFRGGEPFYIDFHKTVLKKIGVPSDCTVMYQTNGSIYPDNEWWDLVKDFNKIHFSFSIDAINDRYNYIRSFLNYDKVKENIIKILSDKRINITADIEVTINPLNAYYFDEIIKLYVELKKFNSQITLNWHQCWDHWGLENTPPNLRDFIRKKYKNSNMTKLIDSFEFDNQKFIKFVENIKLHEKRFNLNGAQIFSEIYPLIIEHYNNLI